MSESCFITLKSGNFAGCAWVVAHALLAENHSRCKPLLPLAAPLQLVALPRDPKLLSKEARKSTPDTAGRNWFDMPSVKVDEEMKRELRLLRLRGAYDPKRFYKVCMCVESLVHTR